MTGAADYGNRFAEIYDELYPPGDELSAVIEGLKELADGGNVLELGVGTGRVAIPACAAGIDITGMDASQSMLDVLASKPGGAGILTFIGDFGTTGLGGPYSLVFVAFNTFFGLLDQPSQVGCFRNVASSLQTGGRFVIEAFVPDLARFDRGQRTSLADLTNDRVLIDVARHDPATQRVSSAHIAISNGSVRVLPVEIRYAWPSELDLMARLAGLQLEHRWEWWDRSTFTSSSPRHVSVYRLEQPEG